METADWAVIGVIIATMTAIIAILVPVLTLLFGSAKTLGRIDERTATLVKLTDDQGQQSSDCRQRVWGRLDDHGDRLTIAEKDIEHLQSH